MDNVKFCNSIVTPDRPRLIAIGFEQLMVLYNLVGTRQNLKISENESEPVSFDIVMDNEGDAIKLLDELNFTVFSVGGNSYSVILGRQDKVILVRIVDAH